MSFFPTVLAQNRTALREGLKIVRRIVATNPSPAGLTTAELYKLALKEDVPTDFKALPLPPAPSIPLNSRGKNLRKPFPVAPHPEHPIKSMSFLKRSVLPILEGNKELKIVRTTRIPFNPASVSQPEQGKRKKADAHVTTAAAPAPVTVWVWQPVDKSTLPKPKGPSPIKKIFGEDVGVGEDWSHLNKRRRRARAEKVWRDVATMKVVSAERKAKAKQVEEQNRERNLRRKLLAEKSAPQLEKVQKLVLPGSVRSSEAKLS